MDILSNADDGRRGEYVVAVEKKGSAGDRLDAPGNTETMEFAIADGLEDEKLPSVPCRRVA